MKTQRWISGLIVAVFGLGIASCGGAQKTEERGVVADDLKLTRAVLYQNGVGYFERHGAVRGDRFSIRIRADQVNDFLKSLTVIDTSDGKAVSVSLPLDRSAAKQVMELANRLRQGIELPELLALLKGTEVTLVGNRGVADGRVLAVDAIMDAEKGAIVDHRVTVMGRTALETILLSDVRTIHVDDGFIALGLHKGLDAAATGGVFRVVDVTVRLDRGGRHDLMVSYVVECPAWKPSYRIVVGDDKEVLVQGWAVVDNISGEDWSNVRLSLTSGAPIAFQYDLYSPRFVGRPDLTYIAGQKTARAQVGEASYQEEAEMAMPVASAPETEKSAEDQSQPAQKRLKAIRGTGSSQGPAAGAVRAELGHADMDDLATNMRYGGVAGEYAPPPAPQVSIQTLQSSARSMVKATAAAGAVRYDLMDPVSVPDRSSTLVSILNHRMPGEEVFLFMPGGAGQGYEENPYRVVRFTNRTGFILEPGPISIYSGGTFVGEGISEEISDGSHATIPFAVDASILVTSSRESASEEARLVKVVKGILSIESFDRIKTTYAVKGGDKAGYRLFVRHPKAGGSYEIKDKPQDTEDVGNAFLVPIDVQAGPKETKYTVVEQTPIRRSLSIWDRDAVKAIELVLRDVKDLPSQARKKLEEVLDKRSRIGTIDTKISHLKQSQSELDERMYQTRENLKALKKNRAATALKAKLAQKLDAFGREADQIARQIVELTNERMELKVAMEDLLDEITLDL